MLDAPVSGGTGRAQSGDLSVIVGGEAEVFAKCEDLFAVMGSRSSMSVRWAAGLP